MGRPWTEEVRDVITPAFLLKCSFSPCLFPVSQSYINIPPRTANLEIVRCSETPLDAHSTQQSTQPGGMGHHSSGSSPIPRYRPDPTPHIPRSPPGAVLCDCGDSFVAAVGDLQGSSLPVSPQSGLGGIGCGAGWAAQGRSSCGAQRGAAAAGN